MSTYTHILGLFWKHFFGRKPNYLTRKIASLDTKWWRNRLRQLSPLRALVNHPHRVAAPEFSKIAQLSQLIELSHKTWTHFLLPNIETFVFFIEQPCKMDSRVKEFARHMFSCHFTGHHSSGANFGKLKALMSKLFPLLFWPKWTMFAQLCPMAIFSSLNYPQIIPMVSQTKYPKSSAPCKHVHVDTSGPSCPWQIISHSCCFCVCRHESATVTCMQFVPSMMQTCTCNSANTNWVVLFDANIFAMEDQQFDGYLQWLQLNDFEQQKSNKQNA